MSVTVAHTQRRSHDTILQTEANVTVSISYLHHKVMTPVAVIITIIIIIIITTINTVTRRNKQMCALQVSLLRPLVLLVKVGWKQRGALGTEDNKVDGKSTVGLSSRATGYCVSRAAL